MGEQLSVQFSVNEKWPQIQVQACLVLAIVRSTEKCGQRETPSGTATAVAD
jgi:hypothetical protein